MKVLMRAVGRIWIPLAVVMVMTTGGLVISRFHTKFGSQHVAENQTDNVVSTIPKYVTYEVDGPASTSGMISYVDERSQPQHEHFDSLPWSKTLATTAPSVFANLIAQGDSHALYCRITVNGQVRDQQAAHGGGTTAFCLVKAA